MSPPPTPLQYKFLIRWFWDCSAAYAEQLVVMEREVGIASRGGPTWDSDATRFEVGAYFAFLLSFALLNHKHDRKVWEDMCYLCEDVLVAYYEPHIVGDRLGKVVSARVSEYGGIANRSSEMGGARLAWLRALQGHVLAAGELGRVQLAHPVVVCDIEDRHFLDLGHVRIDLLFASPFNCGLKHICRRSGDARTLSEGDLQALISLGAKEAQKIATDALRGR